MNSAPKPAKRIRSALLGSFVGLTAMGQPLCDVLLRPAFHYSTQGLTMIVADSSTTYGVPATASWNFGDGATATIDGNHEFATPGIYEVCFTLSAVDFTCSSTFCREVTIPLVECATTANTYFTWQANGTNTLVLSDSSFTAFGGDYLWEFGDGTISTDPTPEHAWLIPGPHFVTLTRRQGACIGTYGAWVQVDGNVGTCGPNLFVDFEWVSGGGDPAVFEPSITANNVTPLASIWSYGDGTVDTSATGVHFYAAPGPFQTCLLVGAIEINPPDIDSCFSLVCRTFDYYAATSVAAINDDPLRVWPNPFTSEINIPLLAGPHAPLIRLFDPLGRVVLQASGNAAGLTRLQTNGLTAGAYILEVASAGIRRRIPVLKSLE